MSQTRRLAAILAADVAGYSHPIGADETGTLQAFKLMRAQLFEPMVARHNGRLGQGSSGLEGEACSTLPMSSQRRSRTAPR